MNTVLSLPHPPDAVMESVPSPLPLRVCDLVQFHSPLSGGIRRYITDKARKLREMGSVQHLIILPGPEDRSWTEEGTRYVQIQSPLLPGSKSYRTFTNPAKIRAQWDVFQPDLIEVADPYQSAWIALRWARHRSTRVMLFYHSDYPRAWHRSLRKVGPDFVATAFERTVGRYLRSLFERADAVLVSTEKYERYWRARLCTPVLNVGLGFDPRVFYPRGNREWVRRNLGIRPDQPVVLFVGRLAREKRLPLLIRSFVQLKRRMADAELVIMGDGEEKAGLERLCLREGVFTKWLPYGANPEVLAATYSAADVYAHPARNETFGLTVIESLACGTPVVAFHQSGLEEACRHSSRSVLVREGDLAAFTEAIEAVLKRPHTMEDRNRMHTELELRANLDRTVSRWMQVAHQVYRGNLKNQGELVNP